MLVFVQLVPFWLVQLWNLSIIHIPVEAIVKERLKCLFVHMPQAPYSPQEGSSFIGITSTLCTAI